MQIPQKYQEGNCSHIHSCFYSWQMSKRTSFNNAPDSFWKAHFTLDDSSNLTKSTAPQTRMGKHSPRARARDGEFGLGNLLMICATPQTIQLCLELLLQHKDVIYKSDSSKVSVFCACCFPRLRHPSTPWLSQGSDTKKTKPGVGGERLR